MTLTKEQVRAVALLARLQLSDDEVDKYARQLGAILGYVEKLTSLDVTGVEPMAHAVPLATLERPDELVPSLTRDEAMANAPHRLGEGLAVPKIIE